MATPAELATYFTYTSSQETAILITERVTSVFSIVSCLFVFTTFLSSKRFRKPVNRLLFYATVGNFLMNIGTLTSFAGIYAGRNSALCQFQGFLIQMFLPADALWNLSMAINTYLTVFKKWPSVRLKVLDKWYFLFNYGTTFIIALVYCFISNAEKGKMYGPAVLWCWIDTEWDVWRVITCYAPAWVAIFTSFCIYIAVGINIHQKRNQLRAFRQGARPTNGAGASSGRHWSENYIRTTVEMHVKMEDFGGKADESDGYDRPYVCTAEAVPRNPFDDTDQMPQAGEGKQLASAALEANAAAVGYAKCAMLFFMSLLITWVPSSTFRVSSVISPSNHIFGLAYATGLVLPLQGFWNAIIYIVTSRRAIEAWFTEDLGIPSVMVSLGLRSEPQRAPPPLWPPPIRPSNHFAHKASNSGSFDRLC